MSDGSGKDPRLAANITDARTACPFCCLAGPFAQGLANHMAFHMEQLVCFAVPRDTGSGHDDAPSQDSNSGHAQGVWSADYLGSDPLTFSSASSSTDQEKAFMARRRQATRRLIVYVNAASIFRSNELYGYLKRHGLDEYDPGFALALRRSTVEEEVRRFRIEEKREAEELARIDKWRRAEDLRRAGEDGRRGTPTNEAGVGVMDDRELAVERIRPETAVRKEPH